MKDRAGEFVTVFAAIELREGAAALGFIINVRETVDGFVDPSQFCNRLRKFRGVIPDLEGAHNGERLHHPQL